MQFEKKILINNLVLYIPLPKDLADYMELKEGTEIIIQDEKGKKGKYLTIWVKGQ